jgi:hypothetical protein
MVSGVDYEVCDDVDRLQSKGIRSVPTFESVDAMSGESVKTYIGMPGSMTAFMNMLREMEVM